MTKDDICLNGIGLDEAIRLAVGSVLMGCGYSLSGCDPVIEVGSKLYRLGVNDLVVEVVDGRDTVRGVSLNNALGKAYIHRLKDGGKTLSAYMTDKPVDPLVFIGGLYCLLSRGMELLKAFNKVMDTLSIDPRIPFKKILLLLDEYEYFKRLVEASHRLRDHAEIIAKLLGETIILGCRPSDESLILFKIIIADHNFAIYSPPIISSVKLYTEFGEEACRNRCFICSRMAREESTKRLGIETVNIGDYKCLLGDDPVRLLILLEKKFYSSS